MVTSCGAMVSHLGSVVVLLGAARCPHLAKCCPWHQDGTLSPSQESNTCVIIIILQHLIQSSIFSLGLRQTSSGRWKFYSPESLDTFMNVRTSDVSIATASRGFWFYVKVCPLPSESSGWLYAWLQIWHSSELLCISPDQNDKPRLRHMSPSWPTDCCEASAEVLVLSHGAWTWKDVWHHSSLVIIWNLRDTNNPQELSVMWAHKLTLSMLRTHVS